MSYYEIFCFEDASLIPDAFFSTGFSIHPTPNRVLAHVI